MLQKLIRRKLNHYRKRLSFSDPSLPYKISNPKRVAVIGGGIAGISAASNLSERGFEVHLYEKESFLGGKVGSWEFESKGETLRTEHGFHGFFRQYFNLRYFLKKIGAHTHLIPISDYTVFYDQKKQQSFKNLSLVPGLNIADMRKHGVFSWGTMINPFSLPLIDLLRFDFSKTYKKYDTVSFADFARRTRMNNLMKIIFNSFSRAFFAEPEDMSMAELIKSFHFYFLSNEEGLLYDVLDDDFQRSFISYC